MHVDFALTLQSLICNIFFFFFFRGKVYHIENIFDIYFYFLLQFLFTYIFHFCEIFPSEKKSIEVFRSYEILNFEKTDAVILTRVSFNHSSFFYMKALILL